MGNKKKSKQEDALPIPINEDRDDRERVADTLPTKKKCNVADDIRVLSALSFVLGGSFLSMFNSFMSHPVSKSCVNNIEESPILKFYVVIATFGFMTLFCTGLICYELFRLFNQKKNVSNQWNYFKGCCVLVFSGIIISFAGQSISLYIIHCKIILFYVPVLVFVFLVTMVIIGLFNYKLNNNKEK